MLCYQACILKLDVLQLSNILRTYEPSTKPVDSITKNNTHAFSASFTQNFEILVFNDQDLMKFTVYNSL